MWLRTSGRLYRHSINGIACDKHLKHWFGATRFEPIRNHPIKKSQKNEKGDWVFDKKDEIEKSLFKQISTEELMIYRESMDPKEISYFKDILQGRSLSKVPKSEMNTLLKKMLTLDLKAIPQLHIICIAKWVGTGVVRRFEDRDTKKMLLHCYDELKNRGFFDSLLVIKEDSKEKDRFDPKRLTDCHSLLNGNKELATAVSIAYEKAKANPDQFIETMNFLVELSNLHIYIHDFYQSAKLILNHAIGQANQDQDFIYGLAIRLPNYSWGMMKLNWTDTAYFHAQLTTALSLQLTELNFNKIFAMAYNLIINYYFTPDSLKTETYIQSVKGVLESILQKNEESPSVVMNSKLAHQICQLMMCLFPEVGPALKTDTMDNFQLPKGHHFEDFFYRLKKLFLPALWIVHRNLQCMVGNRTENIAYIRYSDNFSLISKPSIYNRSRKFEDRLHSDLQAHAGETQVKRGEVLGFYEVDFFVGDSLCIEAHTRIHYAHETKYLVLSTVLKERHLRDMGFSRLVWVHQDDYERIPAREIPDKVKQLLTA